MPRLLLLLTLLSACERTVEPAASIGLAPPAEVPALVEPAPEPAPLWPDEGAPLHLAPPPGPGPQARVFVSAGHGTGRNHGNRGARCQAEEDTTLALAVELEQALLAAGRFQVGMGRRGDERPDYSARAAAAAAWGAEALVELHTDARGGEALVPAGPPEDPSRCHRFDGDPGFAILFSDEGDERRVARQRALARVLASHLLRAGFPATDGVDYRGEWAADEGHAGVFVDRHEPGHRVYMLRGTAMPSVLIETHNAVNLPEVEAWDRPQTRIVFQAAVVAALAEWADADQGSDAAL